MDPILATLQRELASRYAVDEVGRGGMAVVFGARDLRHGRRVAIKVLRRDTGSATAAHRFLREIRTVAPLHHPHILSLYDSGVAGDHFFFVMPFVEGESLRERLTREGRLPVADALSIAREVADALAFAHERGIVHRDIKPENILLSAGHAVVADFGIARAMDEAGFTAFDLPGAGPVEAPGVTMTATGVAVGTPLYMSPEQAAADTSLDGRTDQYALGCVMFEMLTGAPPFTGPSALAILSRHTADPVPLLGGIRVDLPVALDAIIARALAKNPADRFPTTREFAAAIESSIHQPSADQVRVASRRRATRAALTAAAILAAVVATWRLGPGTREMRAAVAPSVGVLPFTYSGDSAFAYLSQGIGEGVAGGLYRVPGLRTVALTRDTGTLAASTDPVRAGREHGLTMVVTGLAVVADGQMRVTPHLIRVADSAVVWSGEVFVASMDVSRRMTDFFAIQDSISARVVVAAIPGLTPAQRASAMRGTRTSSTAAWDRYLDARRLLLAGDSGSVLAARSLLGAALSFDSTFADAWTALAFAADQEAHFSDRPPEDFKVVVRRALNRAIQYDPGSGYALAQRGVYTVLND